MEELLGHLKEVFHLVEKTGFTLNRDKVHLAQSEIKFLGHSLSADGIKILLERVEAIPQFPPPKNLKAVRRFLEMVGFYANSIKNVSQLAEPLQALKRKKAAFVWDEPQERAFEQLKVSISTPPVLQVPDFSKKFVLACDSSDFANSAVLNQRQEKGLDLVAFVSRLLTAAERKYFIHEKGMPCCSLGMRKVPRLYRHTCKELTLHNDNQVLS
jgi:hypothetical protein